MATEDEETRVDDEWAVRIPPGAREKMDLQPGDRLQWSVDDDGRLVATVVPERHGAADNLDPVDMGETDAVDVTDSYDWS